MEIIELKNITEILKNGLEGLRSRERQRFAGPGKTAAEKINRKIFRSLWDRNKLLTFVSSETQEERKEGGTEKALKKKKNSTKLPKFGKDVNLEILDKSQVR